MTEREIGAERGHHGGAARICLRQIGSPYPTVVFMVVEGGVPAMRLDNAGPFSKREALRLKHWIEEFFGG